MARYSSRKTSKRSSRRSSKRASRKTSMRRKPMVREATECSRLPANRCNAMNPNCAARKAPGRRTKICVRKGGVRKGSMYEGPMIM